MLTKKNYFIFKPRFAETDMMQVVHHSRYWVWFEEARFAFIENVLGMSVGDLETSKIFLPVIECSCSYINKIKWGNEFVIVTVLELNKSPYFIFHQEIYFSHDKDKSNPLCKSYVKKAFVDENFKLKFQTPSFFKDSIKRSIMEEPSAFIKPQKI
ncbi:thioesterase family protein [Maribacter sp. M208]|uniref:acyl-CoA thioesterase n=1 Tax=Maribacter huludaoensis TaxID=3030010 RepID=UPI0023EAD165|nr:thioesterase family protein [Maribacter huludaoensis]MDF4221053.1 thioesterase family protein [Maribacter huludaoensis]